jgi:hypothetical protein
MVLAFAEGSRPASDQTLANSHPPDRVHRRESSKSFIANGDAEAKIYIYVAHP